MSQMFLNSFSLCFKAQHRISRTNDDESSGDVFYDDEDLFSGSGSGCEFYFLMCFCMCHFSMFVTCECESLITRSQLPCLKVQPGLPIPSPAGIILTTQRLIPLFISCAVSLCFLSLSAPLSHIPPTTSYIYFSLC